MLTYRTYGVKFESQNSKVVQEFANALHETTFFSLLSPLLLLLLFFMADRPLDSLLGELVVMLFESQQWYSLVVVMAVAELHPPCRDLTHAAAEHLRIEGLALAGQYHVVAERNLAAVDPRLYHRLDPVVATTEIDTEGEGTLRWEVTVDRPESDHRQRSVQRDRIEG